VLTQENPENVPFHAPLIAATRGGVIESVHYGSITVRDGQGNELVRIGDPAAPMYARSSLKPLQILAMIENGFEGNPEQIALGAASHSGEKIHLDTVASTLADAGLSPAALRNTPDLPIGKAAHDHAIREQWEPQSITQNCSGKHAAMLATCVINGWDTETYLHATHPLQRAIRATIERVTGEEVQGVTVDGCGAPLFYQSLDALARGFAHIARTGAAEPQSPEGLVYYAITQNPEHLGGKDRDVTAMMRAFEGLMCKDGAESVHAGAFADGSSFALKISDGGARGRIGATLRALEILGHHDESLNDAHLPKVLGHGNEVGRVSALF